MACLIERSLDGFEAPFGNCDLFIVWVVDCLALFLSSDDISAQVME